MDYDVRTAIAQLNRADLTIDDRNLLTTAVLDKLGALPFSAILTHDGDGTLLLHGKSLDIEKAEQLRESAKSALSNGALALIREQVAFLAVTIGIHKATTNYEMMFGRTALWWGEKELEFLKALAQSETKELAL